MKFFPNFVSLVSCRHRVWCSIYSIAGMKTNINKTCQTDCDTWPANFLCQLSQDSWEGNDNKRYRRLCCRCRLSADWYQPCFKGCLLLCSQCSAVYQQLYPSPFNYTLAMLSSKFEVVLCYMVAFAISSNVLFFTSGQSSYPSPLPWKIPCHNYVENLCASTVRRSLKPTFSTKAFYWKLSNSWVALEDLPLLANVRLLQERFDCFWFCSFLCTDCQGCSLLELGSPLNPKP